jgi:hypothetical protein
VADWTSAVAAPAVVAAVVAVAASGVAGIVRWREERRDWLRGVRHEKYGALIDAGRRLAEVMRWTGPYEDYPAPLKRAYDAWLSAAVAAHLLAGSELQQAITKARFAAARYQETRKPYAQFQDWMDRVETAARAELGLPEYAGWYQMPVYEEVIGKVDHEEPIPPLGSAPHWTQSGRDDAQRLPPDEP